MDRLVARELIDDPVESLAELEGSFADIEFANAAFNGTAPVRREVRRLGGRTLLDVGCGSADIPLALVRDAVRQGRRLSVTALDHSADTLAIARRRTGGHPDVSFVTADGGALPFDDGAFDIVTCNLALHHFEPAAAVVMLRELRRVARLSPVVCDLRRTPLGYAAAVAWSRALTRNRLTRNDAPLSFRRAYTPAEVTVLARDAGWTAPVVRREAFFRMTLVDRL